MMGYVHSIQSLGAVDGPGIRFTVFLQGCPLRCGCCHNPDTWEINAGTQYTAEEILKRAVRCKEYFGRDGGITVSGGEPLLQSDFVHEIFGLCHENGINTCLDTSGCILNDSVRALLLVTDRVLLDIKYTSDELYKKHVGTTIKAPLEFLSCLNAQKIKTTLRQVIIPTLNDNKENIEKIRKLKEEFSCIDTIELLPFKKMCRMKYDKMGIDFPFAHIPEPLEEKMEELNSLL